MPDQLRHRLPPWIRGRLLPALACALVVLLGVAWVAGRESRAGGPGRPAALDAVRLGPDPGQRVADYLAALPARLPPAGAPPVPALVQFRDELDPTDAVRVLAGVTGAAPLTAVFRVPLARVQTALRFQPLSPVDAADPRDALLRRFALAQQAAGRDAAEQAVRLTGRPGAVARYEAGVLGGETGGASSAATPARDGASAGAGAACRCVLAVLVLGDRPALNALAALAEVRAVDAAPEGTPPTGVALAPLLPEQTDVAGPVPDDGPVPASVNPG